MDFPAIPGQKDHKTSTVSWVPGSVQNFENLEEAEQLISQMDSFKEKKPPKKSEVYNTTNKTVESVQVESKEGSEQKEGSEKDKPQEEVNIIANDGTQKSILKQNYPKYTLANKLKIGSDRKTSSLSFHEDAPIRKISSKKVSAHANPPLAMTKERRKSIDKSKKRLKTWARSMNQNTEKRDHPRIVDIVLQAMEQEKRKATPAALCCPCYMVATPGWRSIIKKCINNPFYNVVSVICTFFCLFGDDIVIFLTPPAADPILHTLFLLCFIFFLLDLIGRSSLNRKYVYCFMWWLDCAAIASLIPDIPLLSNWLVTLFNLDQSSVAADEQISLARAGRAARAGTRAGRIMKLMRVIRLVRMLKLFQLFKRKKFRKIETPTSEIEMTHVGTKISSLIEMKVIFGVMLMILVLPLMQYEEDCDAQFIASFVQLESLYNFAMNCVDVVDCMGYFNDTSNNFVDFNEVLYLQLGGIEYYNDTIQIGATVRPSHTWTIELTANDRMMSGGTVTLNRTLAILNETQQERDKALYSFLQTQIVILLLGIQAHLLNKDVDRLLVKPLQEMNNYVKPYMKAAMKEWAATTMVNRKVSAVAKTKSERFKRATSRVFAKKEEIDKESISTAIMMATIKSMKKNMDETSQDEWNKKEGKRKLWQSVRVMLHNKDRVDYFLEQVNGPPPKPSKPKSKASRRFKIFPSS